MEYKPTEFDRFFEPNDWIGLRSWAYPDKSRLLQRLKKIGPRDTILERRGLHILRDFFGDRVLDIGFNHYSYGFMRLLAIDWVTRFKVLGFFAEEEVRDYARIHGPPQKTVLSQFWYGLYGGDTPHEIERIALWRPRPMTEKQFEKIIAKWGY